MLTGLLHSHTGLAYLIFLVALLNLVLILARARVDADMAKIAHYVHTFGLLMLGRINLVLGLALWAMMYSSVPLATTWWMWVSLLLWAPIEIVGKRFVKAELQHVRDGGAASGRLVGGAALELLFVVLIFGLMSAGRGL